LTTSTSPTTAEAEITSRELFVSPCTTCMQNAVRGMTLLGVQLGEETTGIACDSSRGTKKLRTALTDDLVEGGDEIPVGFVLTAPAGLTRTHSLRDRSGFVHSQARGLDSGLHALASHLTAFVPPDPGVVRLRARAIVASGRTVIGLFPHLYAPAIEEKELAEGPFAVVDRLAIDVDVATGELRDREIPWTGLADLGGGAGHVPSGASPRRVEAIVSATPALTPPPTRAGVVAALAREALCGRPEDVLTAAVNLVAAAELLSAAPQPGQLSDALRALGLRSATAPRRRHPPLVNS
jgi:hypothetical protein